MNIAVTGVATLPLHLCVSELLGRHSPSLQAVYQDHIKRLGAGCEVSPETLLNNYWCDMLHQLESLYPTVDTMCHRVYLSDAIDDSRAWLRYFEERILPLVVHYRIPNPLFIINGITARMPNELYADNKPTR
jgi:hypothetical protein